MKIGKTPIAAITAKSFRYTFKDKRKLISLIIVLLLPLIGNSWRFVPADILLDSYPNLQVLTYIFSINFLLALVSIAWFLTIHRKDFALQIIAMAALFYGIFTSYDALPFSEGQTSIWLDVAVSFFIFLIVCIYLYYIHKNYINRSIDYKQLHDGIVHDLHHERFMNEISRIEGLMDMAEMEEPYKSLCQKEVGKLRESITYIADKYSELR